VPADAVAARRRRLVGDAGCLLAIAGVLSAALLPTYAIHDYAFPVGPDAPVYIWWSRLAGHEGLGAVAGRPGVPALALVISGVLRIGIATTVAALEIAFTAVVATAAAALSFEPGGGRARWVVPAVLSGVFSVLLAVGYVGTLAAAALFLATCAALAAPGRRAVALGSRRSLRPAWRIPSSPRSASPCSWVRRRSRRCGTAASGR
jgi:hypothetical protein